MTGRSNPSPVTFLVTFSAALLVLASGSHGCYWVGTGSSDMTGPAADVNMMGYSTLEQVAAGIHFRLRARAFIVAQGQHGARFAFVNIDAAIASQLVTIKVIQTLRHRFGDLYNESNVAITATHTHSGPAGYSQYVLYSITSFGFVKQSFAIIVKAIVESITQAHHNLRPGSIYINKGEVVGAGINRSPSAYFLNPKAERAKYPGNVDCEMTLLKLVDEGSGQSVGGFNWFATHGTSMGRSNTLISGDNKGAAARLFEDWFSSTHQQPHMLPQPVEERANLVEVAKAFKATGGQLCHRTSSRAFKVRKTSGPAFVGAFCQSNAGDVSPNVVGAFCARSGVPCDFDHSSCQGNAQICRGRGPGYPDEIQSTKIIGDKQFQTAVQLFQSAREKLEGKIDYRHTYLNMSSLKIEVQGNNVVETCPAALGPGFAAGTTDGPGAFGFQQGDKQISPLWRSLRTSLKEPSQLQLQCHEPKAILLDVGEMHMPLQWVPDVLPIQILRIGKLFILSVPGGNYTELTTMAGRRLRQVVKHTLIHHGKGEFDDDTHVVIAGIANAYSQYITTFEEYHQQRHEGASTLYGPRTLTAYIDGFRKLAASMAAKGLHPTPASPFAPPDLSSAQFGGVLDPLCDSIPPRRKFGDVHRDVRLPPNKTFFPRGERVSATFWSANPRNDLLTEGTFAVVEMLRGERWVAAYDDDDLSLFFKWRVQNYSFGFATVEWEIPENAPAGVYRLRHFGAAKLLQTASLHFFTGASTAFAVW